MFIKMLNGWYFFWLAIATGTIVGLYFLLKNRSEKVQKGVLFSLLVLGFVLHFLKVYIPPYSVDEARMLRDSWFVNICGANIALFPFMFWSKNKKIKDYMVYIGIISGLIALVYPQEPIAKTNQYGEQLDIIRFYYHHWMVLAVPLLMVLFRHHTLSYKRVLSAPTGLLLLMLFIMLNQLFQAELGYIPLRDGNFYEINFKNSSYIWGPDLPDGIGKFLSTFTPKIFRTVPVGEFAGTVKYWPWFWLIVPVYVLVTPMSILLALNLDHKSLKTDVKKVKNKLFKKKVSV